MSLKSSLGSRPRYSRAGFTIMEMLVSVAVLVMLVLLFMQLINSATAITRTQHKHIDTDTEARAVFDRMAVDFAQMLRRTDIDYYVKGPAGYKNPNAHGNGNGLHLKSGDQGNDQIAFFSQVPGYNSTGYPSAVQSALSLVAYRVVAKNSDPLFLQLQRMGKGLLWNGVDTRAAKNSTYPIIFAPGQIAPVDGSPATGPWAKTWPWYYAVNNDNTSTSTSDPDYEVIGPDVFRFEYYYLLKDGTVTDFPHIPPTAAGWDFSKTLTANLNAFKDVEAIVVAIAVIDPATRSLVFPNALFNLMSDMADFKNANGKGVGAQKIGDVENEWNTVIKNAATTGHTSDNSAFPPAAAAAIRVYNRYFELKTL
jgi:hypothetical protein